MQVKLKIFCIFFILSIRLNVSFTVVNCLEKESLIYFGLNNFGIKLFFDLC